MGDHRPLAVTGLRTAGCCSTLFHSINRGLVYPLGTLKNQRAPSEGVGYCTRVPLYPPVPSLWGGPIYNHDVFKTTIQSNPIQSYFGLCIHVHVPSGSIGHPYTHTHTYLDTGTRSRSFELCMQVVRPKIKYVLFPLNLPSLFLSCPPRDCIAYW
jgi:hypothetical protein